MAGVLGAVVLLVLAWFLVPFGLRKWEEARLQARCRALKAIVLTYDDGPGTILTERLLDLLSRRGVKASFFVLGRNAAARPEIVRRLVAEGHEVGSHTQEHSNAWKTDPFTAARDLARGIGTASALGADAAPLPSPLWKAHARRVGRRRPPRSPIWLVDRRQPRQLGAPPDPRGARRDRGAGAAVSF